MSGNSYLRGGLRGILGISLAALSGAGILVLLFGLSGCTHEKPNYIYMPDMVYSPAYKAQKPGSLRVPPAGVVPVGFEPYAYRNDPEGAGRELRNPLEPTPAVLHRGQAVFDTFCIVCHGPGGHGNGYIVPKFPKPPSLHAKPKTYPDGRIFHIITMGQNMMPSHAAQIPQQDRWAVIHYVRVLQGLKPGAVPQVEAPPFDPAMFPAPSPSPSPSPDVPAAAGNGA